MTHHHTTHTITPLPRSTALSVNQPTAIFIKCNVIQAIKLKFQHTAGNTNDMKLDFFSPYCNHLNRSVITRQGQRVKILPSF
jgi:hypothetical protein